jgi:hypothetical protein
MCNFAQSYSTMHGLNSFCSEPPHHHGPHALHGILSHRIISTGIICAYYQPHTKTHMHVSKMPRDRGETIQVV